MSTFPSPCAHFGERNLFLSRIRRSNRIKRQVPQFFVTQKGTIDSRLRRTQQPAAEQAQSNADASPARFRPARARSCSCLRRVVSLPPSVRALVSSSAGGPFARIRALASPSPSRMHVYPSVCGPLVRNRALASLSGNGVFRENFPAIERTAVWSAI